MTASELREAGIADSVRVLAQADLSGDPYWPKWNAPWWHFLLLVEIGRADAVPPGFARRLLEKCARYYPPVFGPRREDLCFCAAGCVLTAALKTGLSEGDVTAAWPWVFDFLKRYQQADGGWNCDEGVHARSSVVSTVPVLEFLVEKPTLEREMMDRALTFLLELKFCRSRSTGRLLNEAWLTRARPRFYEYDVERGFDVATRAAQRLGRPAPVLTERLAPGTRDWVHDQSTRGPHGVTASFPLLDAVSA
jgi:hypothetical protein